jgi:hypothetical protein
MAIANRKPGPGLVHHSDQRFQYTSLGFGALSYIATLKSELLHRYSWPTRLDAELAIFDYVEAFYNRKRRHATPTIERLSPEALVRETPCILKRSGVIPRLWLDYISVRVSADFSEVGSCSLPRNPLCPAARRRQRRSSSRHRRARCGRSTLTPSSATEGWRVREGNPWSNAKEQSRPVSTEPGQARHSWKSDGSSGITAL